MISQKRPSEPCQFPAIEASGQTVRLGQNPSPARQSPSASGPNLLYSDFTSPATPPITIGAKSVIFGTSAQPLATTTSNSNAVQEDTQTPAAKRRRVEKPKPNRPTVQSTASNLDDNVIIPTIEMNAAVTEETPDANVGSASTQRAKSKVRGLSTQAKRMQEIEDEAAAIVTDAIHSPSSKTKKPRKIPKGKGVRRNDDEGSGATAGAPYDGNTQPEQDAIPETSKKRYARKRGDQTFQEAAAEIVGEAIQPLSQDHKKRGRKDRQRAATPEGADAVLIAPSEVKMSDLCKDTRTGRKSEKEKDIAELERAEFVRKKQRQLQEVMGQVEPVKEAVPSTSTTSRLERLERLASQREREESVAQNVPNTIIINGQIQIDEDSLQIDRHAAAAAARAEENIEVIEETDLTRKVNFGSWLKRDKSGGWNEFLTERFYEGLRMFGTDFEMISKMFPGRTRHKIKLKFVKEEKLNHDKIKATLLGEKVPVDLPELEKMAGVEFDDPKELERDMEEDRKRLEEETLAEKEEMDNARRKRDEEIAAERAAAGEESSAKENRRGKNKRKKGEKHKGRKGASRRQEKHPNKGASSGGGDVLNEIGEA